MGCFLACFGGAKDRKQRRRNKKSLPTNNPVNRNYKPLQISSSLHKSVIQQESDEAEIFQSSQTNLSPQKPIIKEAAAADVSELSASVPELREKEEQPNSISCRKKVTFDLNVKTYQNVAFGEAINDPLEDEEGKGEVKDKSKGKVSPDPNYRYQNCDTSDDEGIEDDDEEFDDSDFDDEDFDDEVAVVGAGEESYDPFFSLPMDKEKQQHDSEEVNSPVPTSSVSANRGARDRSQYVHSVLNPVENLSQWKEVKVRALPLKNPNKENNNAELESKMKGSNNESSGSMLETKLTGFSPEPTFKNNRPQKPSDLTSMPNYSTKQEISMDASLSTWLVSSENSPKGSNSHWSNSTVSREEQPILGALTVEDLKQSSSVTSSPRRSPSRNPDEIPILGTVGSYWNSRTEHSDIKGIPNTTSKYREDKRVNWHSTPFKVRLERALNEGAAEAFMIFETRPGQMDSMIVEVDEDPGHVLIQLAKDTEALALAEKETFSPVLKRWHPVPAAIAVASLHHCFGVVLKQYLAKVSCLSNEMIQVLQSAGKLEKVLVQMVVEDCVDCDHSGKDIVREMLPYEVDSIITGLLKSWIEERLRMGRECLKRAKETESWIPRSKAEPCAQSAVDLMKLAKVTVDEFFEIPVSAREDMVQDLAEGLESIFHEYTAFVASCGTKQSYLPPLPPLTRCNQDSWFARLWKKAKPIKSTGSHSPNLRNSSYDGDHPRPSTSRGTQRLYIRLNTLYYLHSHIHSLDKSLSFFTRNHHGGPSPSVRAPSTNRRLAPSHHFDFTRATIQSAVLCVSEVAAYRLIFLDCNHTFYDGLYIGNNESSRIRPALRILKQNLMLLITVLTDRAQPGAVKEVMKAAFEAFLMVLLAGGSERVFVRSDYDTVLEDFRSLKRLFCTSGEGLVAENMVDEEAEVVEGILTLMGMPAERLIEEFSIAACESSGMGGMVNTPGRHRVLPMPPTTGRWSRSDPNTVLRVLCHRNDDAANQFLKKTFQLPKRR